MKSTSTCSGLLEIRRSSCVSVSIFFGMRFRITSLSGRTRWRSASGFSSAKMRSESRMSLAGRPLGILIGMFPIMVRTGYGVFGGFHRRAAALYENG